MSFLINGFKELLRYGDLGSRTTKVQIIASLTVMLPLLLVIAVGISAMTFEGTREGIIAAGIISSVFLILSGPFFIAVIIRRVNDQFPNSAWARFFSRDSANTALNILKFAGLWIALIICGSAIYFFFWPTYLLLLVSVLVLPKPPHIPISTAYAPPPPMRSGILPPPPTSFPSVESTLTNSESGDETPAYRQGIFWFAVTSAVLVTVLAINPALFGPLNPSIEEPLPANSARPAETSTPEVTVEPTESITPTPILTPSPTVVSEPSMGSEQTVQVALDPRFQTCRDANASGFGDYVSGIDPEYDWYMDRDRDGIVCER